MSPVVPSYERSVLPDVSPSFRADPSAPIEAFGGGGAAAAATDANVQQLNTAQRIVLKAKADADDLITKDWYNKATSLKNDLTYNEENGWSKIEGNGALRNDFIPEQNKRLEDGFAELDKGINSKSQRDFVENIKGQIRNEYNTGLNRHYTQERVKVQQQTDLTTVATATEDAVLNYFDRNKTLASSVIIDGINKGKAERNELTPEAADFKSHVDKSGMYRGIIESMTSNPEDYEKAKAFYDGLNKEIEKPFTVQDKEAVDKMLEISTIDGQSLSLSRDIISKVGTDLTGQKKALSQIDNAKIYDQVRARLHGYNADEENRLKQVKGYQIDAGAKYVEDYNKQRVELAKSGQYDKYAGQDALMNMPAKMKAQYDNKDLATIKGIVNPPIIDDSAARLYLTNLMIDDQEAFLKEDPKQHFPNLSLGGRKWYMNQRAIIANRDDRTEYLVAKSKADRVALETVMNDSDLKPTVPNDKEHKTVWNEYNEMVNKIDSQYRLWAQDQKGIPDPQVQESFLRGLVKPYTRVKKWWLDEDVPLVNIRYEDMSDTDKKRIYQILLQQSENKTYPTNQEIVQYFIGERAGRFNANRP